MNFDTERAGGKRRRRTRTGTAMSRAAVAAGTVVAFLGAAGQANAAPAPTARTGAPAETVELLTPEFADRMRARGAAKAAAGLADPTCGTVAWQNLYQTRYVSAELDYTGSNYGMLRARASIIGPYERFQYCWYSAGYFTLKSLANGRFVSAELSYTGSTYAMLRARAYSIGSWERFTYINNSGVWWWRNQGNSRWVRAEVSYAGSSDNMLRASYGSPNPSGINDNTLKFWRPLIT